MPTPRKVTQETWFDIWAEWPAADRAAAIKALELTNRQLLKLEAHGERELTQREKNVQATRTTEEVGKIPVTYDGPEGDPALRQKSLEGWKVPCIKCGLYDGKHGDGCPAGEQDRLTLMKSGNKAEE